MTLSSFLSSNPPVNSDRSSSTGRRKKKKIQSQALRENDFQQQNSSSIQWKSESQQQIYSSKLLHALRGQARHSRNAKRVRQAADGVLAATAKGRSRWSRAILTNHRLKLKFMKKRNIVKRQHAPLITTGKYSRSSVKRSKLGILRLKSKSLPAVQRKARVLSRLVPGCRRQPLPVVLEEAIDYIPALEMQIRAMSALVELLSSSSSTDSAAASGGGLNRLGSSQPRAS